MTEVGSNTGAADILRELLAVLPDNHLLMRDPAREITGTCTTDVGWLREQIRLRGLIWGIDDPFVLGTLWWYSASNWLVMPTVTSWFVTGRALSPRLDAVRLFHQPDSRIPGSRSVALGPTGLAELGAQLRESVGSVIRPLAMIVGKGERRLWSFAVDAIVGRILWAARHTNRTRDVLASARTLVRAMSDELPMPRLSIADVGDDQRVHVRRGSCCLLYQVPGAHKCSTCPRQTPSERMSRLRSLER